MIEFKTLKATAKVPKRQSEHAAGFDLHATSDHRVWPGQHLTVSTGLACAIPEGAVGLIRPRSGLASRNGIHTLAGVIDADYRGEIKVILVNLGDTHFDVEVGDRIAQMVVVPTLTASKEVKELKPTVRGSAGFGSTG